mmetsp:Transcript_75451/g.110537  ORF Transcript_75451/g.110537 Transcript_75451/m.110537 type:complete len:303 (-) Transcript_75451:806-1714(-)
MGRRAITPQIQVPPVVLFRQSELLELRAEHVHPFLPLTTTHKLADTRHQEIRCCYCLAVIVVAHVEGLDATWVIVDKGRSREFGLCQPSLMLRAEVGAEDNVGELPLGSVFAYFRLKKQDGVVVGDPCKGRVDQGLEPLQQRLVIHVIEELHVLGAALQHVIHDIFDVGLGICLDSCQIGEGHFGLDHPEFGQMAGCLTVLSPEGGAKGVDVAQRARIRLATKLSRHGQEGRFAEEVVAKVHLTGLGFLERIHVSGKSGDSEHFACSLAVAGCDDRSLEVEKPLLLEKGMRRLGERRPNTSD